jgi:hypothetical protein
MAYDAKDIKSLVNEVLDPFRDLDDRETMYQQIEAGTYAWEQDIPKELGQPVPAISRGATELVQLMDAVLSIALRPVVHLSKSGDKADEEADALEVFWDYWSFRTDPYGVHRRRARDHQIRSRFGVNILSIKPQGGDGYDEESYWRWELHSPDPRTVGVLEHNDDYTVAVLEEEIPYLDLAKYLKGRRDGEPAKDFLSRKLKGLAIGDGIPMTGSNDARLPKIKRCVVYTDEDICQYVQVARGNNGSSATSYEQMDDAEPNPFGRVPVVLYPGIYRSHMPVAERYEGVMWPAMQTERNLILMNSIALTIYGNQQLVSAMDKDMVVALLNAMNDPANSGPELGQTLRNLLQPQKGEDGRRGTTLAFGNVADMTPKLDATFATALQAFKEDQNRLAQQWQSVFPTAETVQQATAAGIIASIEQGNRRGEKELASVVAGRQRLFELVAYDICNSYKQDVEFKIYGGEGKAVEAKEIKAGSEFVVTPDMMRQFVDGRATVTLEPAPDTGAQRAAAVSQEIELQAAIGVKNPAKLYEAAGVSNVTERLEEDAALTNAAYLGPGAASMAMQDVLNEFALEQERPIEVLQQLWMPQFGNTGQGQGGGPIQAGGGGFQYRSPERAQMSPPAEAPA